MITVNGKVTDGVFPQTLSAFLQENGYKTAHVAAELNGAIVPKSAYSTCQINDGDHLEVVTFVGGG